MTSFTLYSLKSIKPFKKNLSYKMTYFLVLQKGFYKSSEKCFSYTHAFFLYVFPLTDPTSISTCLQVIAAVLHVFNDVFCFNRKHFSE